MKSDTTTLLRSPRSRTVTPRTLENDATEVTPCLCVIVLRAPKFLHDAAFEYLRKFINLNDARRRLGPTIVECLVARENILQTCGKFIQCKTSRNFVNHNLD